MFPADRNLSNTVELRKSESTSNELFVLFIKSL